MFDIKRLQNVHLEIADEIHRVCRVNKIDYSIVAGTLLGAIRHQGFIPWDDDFDIGMTRENYNKFLRSLDQSLDKNFYSMTLENNQNYGTPILKIMKKGTQVKEGNLPDTIKDYGIFIDVFPFDNVPNSRLKRFHHNISTEIYKKLLLAKSNYKLDLNGNGLKNFIYQMLKGVVHLLPRDFIVKRLNKNMIRYNKQASKYLTNIGGSYGYSKETIKADWFKSLSLKQFEDRQYFSFEAFEEYLIALYGDYMELPPENERYDRHAYESIDFKQ